MRPLCMLSQIRLEISNAWRSRLTVWQVLVCCVMFWGSECTYAVDLSSWVVVKVLAVSVSSKVVSVARML